MKRITFLVLLILIVSGSCKSTKQAANREAGSKATQKPLATEVPSGNDSPKAFDFTQQTSWLLGYFNPAQLTHEPYSVWYTKGFDDYQVRTDAMNKLFDIKKDSLSIKVVMGTWCPDSRREVPRFMKVLEIWQFPASKVTFIGVDDAKTSPVGEYVSLKIERVPTFILYRNNIEAGRIIENPVTSLEQDMVNILTRNEK